MAVQYNLNKTVSLYPAKKKKERKERRGKRIQVHAMEQRILRVKEHRRHRIANKRLQQRHKKIRSEQEAQRRTGFVIS